jgi:hypothetical protein
MATQTINPTADEAVSGTWSGTTGSRYTLVDDYPDSVGSDFLTCSAAGAITFTGSAFTLPAGAIGISVAILYYDEKNGAQASGTAARIKVGGTYYNASSHNPSNGSWVQRTDTWSTNPKTSAAWTVAQINGSDGTNPFEAFGFNCTDASPTVDHSSIQVAVTYNPAYKLTASAGTYAYAGLSADVIHNVRFAADAGHYLISNAYAIGGYWEYGYAVPEAPTAQLSEGVGAVSYVITADTGSRTLTGQAAGLRLSRKFVADTSSYSIVGVAATVRSTKALSAQLGSVTVIGKAASILHVNVLAGSPGSLSLVGKDAAFRKTNSLQGSAGSFTVSGVNAQIVKSTAGSFLASTGNVSVVGVNAALRQTYSLASAAGVFTVVGSASSAAASELLDAESGAIVIGTSSVSFVRSFNLQASTRAFNLNGIEITIRYRVPNQQAARKARYQHYVSNFKQDIVQTTSPEHQLVFYVKDFFRVL